MAFMEVETAYGGVVSTNNLCEWFWEEVFYGSGINLTEYEIIKDYCTANDCTEDEIPEDFWDLLEIDEATYLIGDWTLSDDGKYDVDSGINGKGYAAIVQTLGGAYNVHVVWAETTTNVRSMCSPCCPGQADLDSGPGNIEAYTLPSEFFVED